MAMDDLRSKVIDYLQGHNAMSLSTMHNGQPHAATVFFVNRQYDLFFISSPASRHGQDLAANNRVAATVNEDYSNWGDIKGLQLEGRVEQLGRLSENRELADAFADKFPDTSGFFTDPGELPDLVAEKVARVRFYRFQPSRISYIDNSLGFGHREELTLDDPETVEDAT